MLKNAAVHIVSVLRHVTIDCSSRQPAASVSAIDVCAAQSMHLCSGMCVLFVLQLPTLKHTKTPSKKMGHLFANIGLLGGFGLMILLIYLEPKLHSLRV